MAISAVVQGITVLPDGTVRLALGAVEGGEPGDSPGQETMIVVNPPSPPDLLRGLIDCIIWGGSDELLIGETVFAERIGYTRLRLLASNEAITAIPKKAHRSDSKKSRRRR